MTTSVLNASESIANLFAAGYFMLLAGMVSLFVLLLHNRHHVKKRIMTAVLLVLAFTDDLAIFNLIRSRIYGFKLSGFDSFVAGLPVYVHFLIFDLCTIYTVFSFIYYFITRRYEFRRSSIREALNNLPTGLSFAYRSGRTVLTNHAFLAFAEKVTGEPLKNSEDFWQELKNISGKKGIRKIPEYSDIENGKLMLSFEDGTAWLVSRKNISIKSEEFIETSAYEVTDLYTLYRRAEADNLKLIEKKKEIKELSSQLTEINHEEEVLRHKIYIHNRLGQMVLMTRQFLQSGPKEASQYDEYIQRWKKLTGQLYNIDERLYSGDTENLLKEIVETAGQIGCTVRVSGFDSIIDSETQILRAALREAIVNAVRHGGATEVNILVKHSEGMTVAEISNNGKLPDGPVKPGGGLSAISKRLKSMGGMLEIRAKDRFEIILYIPETEGYQGEVK